MSNIFRMQCAIRGLLIFLAFTTSTPALVSAKQEPLVAVPQSETLWFGELDAGPRVFRFAIKASQNSDGKSSATLTSFDEGSIVLTLDEFFLSPDEMKFTLRATAATYAGKVGKNGSEIQGEWIQGGAKLPLNFTKVAAPPKDQPSEVWQGFLETGGQKLKIQFRTYGEGEEQKALMDSLSQRVGGFKTDVEVSDNSVKFEIPGLLAEFQGARNELGDKIDGVWKQGLAKINASFEKVAAPEIAESTSVRRPQNPTSPFPYRTEDVSFANANAGNQLAGTLTLPNGDGPFSAAILVSGSGAQDRDETLMNHKPFWVLADHLTRNGIAVLRYDDRGVGNSTGDFAAATTNDFAADAQAAFEYLKTRSEIDPNKIGIIGHSEGGLVAPIVAARVPDVAWIVLMAGPGVNGERILLSQGKLIVAAAGGSKSDQERQTVVQTVLLDLIKNSDPKGDLDELIQIGSERIGKQLADQRLAESQSSGAAASEESASDEALKQAALKQIVQANLVLMQTPWFRFFIAHEPGPELEKVRCPVLAINGAKDVQVDAKLNLPKIEAALSTGGNSDFKILELPDLNHLFQTCKTGSVSEYGEIEETISPTALHTISDWILARAKR